MADPLNGFARSQNARTGTVSGNLKHTQAGELAKDAGHWLQDGNEKSSLPKVGICVYQKRQADAHRLVRSFLVRVCLHLQAVDQAKKPSGFVVGALMTYIM
mmetsp:Transcript_1079/g.1845  ORF Transcript_1079/g.1845 Transcript_1079/m.1845 type:complete len:101 (+) Transcript_1079:1040-1342(+)